MKILFLGDSITDWFRNHDDPRDPGKGYVRYAVQALSERFPGLEVENLGVNGYSTGKVLELVESGALDRPLDYVSVLVGVNDFCDINQPADWQPDLAATGRSYARIFREIRARSGARLIVLQPYLCGEHHPYFSRAHLEEEHRQLFQALDGDMLFIPLDRLLNERFGADASRFSKDGVHPLPEGAQYIGEIFRERVIPGIAKNEEARA